MRNFIDIVLKEGIYDDDEFEEESGSPGWWITPDGEIFELQEAGNHGVEAIAWLSDYAQGYKRDDEEDYAEAIEHLKARGGVRLANFHGSDELNIDFIQQALTPAAKTALISFVQENRREFRRFFFGNDTTFQPFNYREVMKRIRGR
jgi:hypothetical protein